MQNEAVKALWHRTTRAIDERFPKPCIGCGMRADTTGICVACRRELPWNLSACRRCAAPLAEDSSACGECIIGPPAWHRARSAFVYETPVTSLIQEFKFARKLATGRVLAALCAEWFASHARESPEVLVPVPLHWRRRLLRHFNQADEIATVFSRRLGLPVSRACRRIRATAPQSKLTASERRRNLRNAFIVTRPLRARHVAVVDDVLTTGSTASAMTAVLAAAGAERVEIWTLARAASHPG